MQKFDFFSLYNLFVVANLIRANIRWNVFWTNDDKGVNSQCRWHAQDACYVQAKHASHASTVCPHPELQTPPHLLPSWC